MRRRLRNLALVLATAIVVVSPHVLRAGDAACSVAASSLTDAYLNPPDGEDTDFFVTEGGVPNVALFLDTSESMLRVAPDGAGRSWGSFVAPVTRYGCQNAYADASTLTFQSSCGSTTLDGLRYDPSKDYYQAKTSGGEYCGYMNQAGKPMATDKPAFDPDFPAYFSRYDVYRDAIVRLPAAGTTGAFTPMRDGWDGASPRAAASSAADFCNTWSGDVTKSAACYACLTTKGYFFDGSYVPWQGPSCVTTVDCQSRGLGTCVKDSNGDEKTSSADNETAHCQVPNVWFTGNYLNFHPPKFIVARKVLKDVLASVKLYRLGFFTLDGSGGGAVNQSNGFNPSCSSMGGESQFFNNRNSVRNAINNTITFSGRQAPLAEALLDLGHLYASASTSPWFADAYDDSDFRERTGNQASVCYACQKSSIIFITDGAPTYDGMIPGSAFAATPMTTTVANKASSYAGMPGYNITDISTADCPTCNLTAELPDGTAAGKCYGQQLSGACNGANEPIQSYLPNVAWYLHNVDARPDAQNDYGGYKMEGKQTLDVYTIGMGVWGNMGQILAHTASAGGGKYWGADAATDLRSAIDKALEEVSTRSIAFGSSSLSTLQASASQGVLIPRFVPSKAALWNGHLYEFDLWSEFTGGCWIPTSGPSGPANKDYDCDGRCTSVFLREKGTVAADGTSYTPGSFIHEDASGAFVVNSSPNLASCGSGNKCTSECSADVYPSGTNPTAAIAWWDAADKLSPVKADGTGPKTTKDYKDWNERKIYTVVDQNAPLGRFTATDPVMQLTDSTTAVAALMPYLNVVGNRTFCQTIADKLTGAGNPEGARITSDLALAAPNWDTCAKIVIEFAMGADVFNERKCSGFPTSYCTRAYQLGDVFHSSPVEVWPPLPSDGLLCVRGLHTQCLPSLFSQSIDQPSEASHANAYDDYAKNETFRHRDKFAVVGANDGMLHAILTGKWRSHANDPRTAQDESITPYEGYHDAGTGEEVWAFVPPDLLPKLHLLMLDEHQYFVDGTAMVRDVWMDGGTSNGGSGLGTPRVDGVRQGSEFHTVAVVGERRGGTHYFALDVTRASDDLDAKPRFLWIYPQPDDKEQLAFGETYSDYVPTAPPIGPVRLDAGAPASDGKCAVSANRVYEGRCVEERWIVFLSGGFDPQFTKGRGVHMVDVASGAELFDFSQPKGSAASCTASSDPRCHLNYPVAAAVGMMMWGKEAKYTDGVASDGYFDTATFGDTGGQLWVLRFDKPGVIDPTTKKVNNWFGARMFQAGKAGSPACGVNDCQTQPFFHITANVALQANGLYRVLAGTGDRFNLLDPTGGVCGPNNIRACIQKGCTVKVDDGSGGAGASYGVDQLGAETYHLAQNPVCASFDANAYTYGESAATSSVCTAASSRVRVSISCPSTVVCTGSVDGETLTKDISVDCTGGSCRVSKRYPGTNIDLKNDTGKKNWFFSVQVFESSGARQIFDTLEAAEAYDAARLDESQLVNINAHDANPTTSPLATADSLGWAYYFDHGDPNAAATVTIDGLAHHIYRSDERVASTTAVEASCTFFNTLQVALPSGSMSYSTDCPANSPCKAGKKQISYLYGASPATGAQCLYVNGTLARSQQTETLVPPHIGKLVAYVASGQVSFGLTSVRIPQGGSNISLGEAQDVTSVIEVLPVDRDLHACRHADRKGAAPTNCK